MIQLFIRFLFVIAGSITSWFVARDTLRFPIVQMVISVLLLTLLALSIAFWPQIKDVLGHIRRKRNKSLKK